MSAFQKTIIILLSAAIVLTAWMLRYEVVVAARGDNLPPAYKLDRWTGSVTFLLGINERPIGPPAQ